MWRRKEFQNNERNQKGVKKDQCKTKQHVQKKLRKGFSWLNDSLQPAVDVPGRHKRKKKKKRNKNGFQFHAVNIVAIFTAENERRGVCAEKIFLR